MIATGIVRRVDDLGRVVIPREIRHRLNIMDGDPLEIYLDGESIVYKKYDVYDSPVTLITNTMRIIDSDEAIDPATKRLVVQRLEETVSLIKDGGESRDG